MNETAYASVSDIFLDRNTMDGSKRYVVRDAVANNKISYRFVKRGLDILLSFFGGVLLLPLMLVVAGVIKLDSPGPAIFKQERLGKNGVSFEIWKFRSMYQDAERNGPQWAEKEDPRCTKVGVFLRKARLDELPQLWNIFCGTMSFVGPRPERACFYEQFETYIHGFSKRMQVTPGLTGLAQVYGGYDLTPEEKIVYDMEYIRKQSLLMDLRCIFKTVKVIFTHEGAR